MTTYVVGDYATLVTDHGVVLSEPDRIADVAVLAERGLAPLTVVEVLSRGDLRDLPDFVAVRVVGGEVSAIVRGAFAVRAAGLSVDGLGVETWTEASAALSGVVEVLPVGTTSGGPVLPLTGGVVRSGGVSWTPGALAAAPAPTGDDARSAPEPLVDEMTVVRSSVVRPAPVGPPVPSVVAGPPAPPVPAPPVPPSGAARAPAWEPGNPAAWQAGPPLDASSDHDGRTIAPAQLQALRAGHGGPGDVPPSTQEGAVVAVALSNGRVIPVRRRVLIGRSPRIQQVGGSANLPALITVDDPYVSSTHLEVAADGARVTVTDTSTNGTLLTRQGRPPLPLDPGVETEVAIGDVLTLSRGLTATVVPAPGR